MSKRLIIHVPWDKDLPKVRDYIPGAEEIFWGVFSQEFDTRRKCEQAAADFTARFPNSTCVIIDSRT